MIENSKPRRTQAVIFLPDFRGFNTFPTQSSRPANSSVLKPWIMLPLRGLYFSFLDAGAGVS
jgi:hypothetical protein